MENYNGKYLHNVARHLILHASYLTNLGICNGKLGIALFFFHYSRYTGKTLHDDFAGELLNEVFEEIHARMPLGFGEGLCGIGWGMLYLCKMGFIEGDLDDILCDIDKKVKEIAPRRMTDISFETGLEGIAAYCYSRKNSLARASLEFCSELDEACLQAGLPYTEEQCNVNAVWEKLLETYSLPITPLPDVSNWKKGITLMTEV